MVLRATDWYRTHSINCVATSVLHERNIAAGTADGAVLVWELPASKTEEQPGSEESSKPKSTKRRKLEITELTIAQELRSIHTMQVTDIQFAGPNQVLTGSQDHSVKLLDIHKGTAVSTVHTAYAGVCGLDSTQSLVLTGLTDATIRQWDFREAKQTRVYADSHSSWISGVAINPLNRNLFLSGSYDKQVCLWDLRGAKKPVRKVCTHKDKVMAVGWNGPQKIISGGSEGQLYVHALTFDTTQ
jgi:WD40 repeat protein